MNLFRFFTGVGIWALTGITVVLAVQGEAPKSVDFVRDIKPIFESKCIRCHGPENEEAFRIDDRTATLDYVIPKDAANSELFAVLIAEEADVRMPPPEENQPLSSEQIATIKLWIESGAEWPDGVTMSVPTESGKSPAPIQGTSELASSSSSQTPKQSETNVQPSESQPAKPVVKPDLSKGEKVWKAVGYLHPAAVHLPIGLLLAAGLFSLLGLRGNFVISDAAYCCLWLGTLTAIVATVLGWSASINEGGPGDLSALTETGSKHYNHRLSAVVVTVFSLLLALYAARARALDPDDGLLWKLGAIVLALGVGYCGYEGGQITHKSSHYNYVYSVVEELTGWEIDGKEGNPATDTSQPPTDKLPESVVPGKTSQEESAAKDKAKAEIAD